MISAGRNIAGEAALENLARAESVGAKLLGLEWDIREDAAVHDLAVVFKPETSDDDTQNLEKAFEDGGFWGQRFALVLPPDPPAVGPLPSHRTPTCKPGVAPRPTAADAAPTLGSARPCTADALRRPRFAPSLPAAPCPPHRRAAHRHPRPQGFWSGECRRSCCGCICKAPAPEWPPLQWKAKDGIVHSRYLFVKCPKSKVRVGRGRTAGAAGAARA